MREMVAANTGMTATQVAECPLFLIGSGAEIRDTLQDGATKTGISYIVIQGQDPRPGRAVCAAKSSSR